MAKNSKKVGTTLSINNYEYMIVSSEDFFFSLKFYL